MALIQNILHNLFKKQPRSNEPLPSAIKLGILPDKPDSRDFKQFVPLVSLPSSVDLTVFVPPIKSQGSIGSCGSHALCTGMETLYAYKKSDWSMPLSELWHYYQVRILSGNYPEDSGQTGRDAMKIANQEGVSPEKLCPYNTLNYNSKPSVFADGFARWFKIKEYNRCSGEQQIKSALAYSQVVWLGIPVANSVFSYRSGTLKYPADPIVGGHAICIVGYDDATKTFKFVNSWGNSWGEKGFGQLSYDYLTKAQWYDAWSFSI